MGSPPTTVLNLALILAAATCLGALIGLERELHHKPAGLRTNALICMGSALFVLISQFMSRAGGASSADPGRIAAQVVTGIGFLGAGTIMRAKGEVHGLTSAATIWAVAGIGMAVGAAYYVGALLATVLVLGLTLLRRWERGFQGSGAMRFYAITADDAETVFAEIRRFLALSKTTPSDVSLTRGEKGFHFDFGVSVGEEEHRAFLARMADLPEVRAVRHL